MVIFMSKKIVIRAVVLAFLTIATLLLFMLLQARVPYVARVDGCNIALSEYYVYLYEQKLLFESRGGSDIWEMDFDGETSEEVAKQNALYSLELVKISVKQAKKMGISLTDAEKGEASDYAGLVYEQMGTLADRIKLTPLQLTAIMEENDLYRKLLNEITTGYVLDEDEFNRYFTSYYNANQDYFENMGNMESLREDLKQNFIEERKFELYLAEYNKWIKNVSTIKNLQVWNKISTDDLNES